jgi:hypothetical protein
MKTETQIVVACGCGKTYTKVQWEALPIKGYQLHYDGGDDLELRNCPAPCSSTHAVWVPCRSENRAA